jgi:hypothetical protein
MAKLGAAFLLTFAACSPNPTTHSAKGSGGTTEPIIPGSWTVATWFVDGQNVSTKANDNNDCQTNSTPCLTMNKVIQKLGCVGDPNHCPRWQQNVTIDFLSSQVGESDVWYLSPVTEGGAFSVVKGDNNGTLLGTGTLTGVTAKNATGSPGTGLILSIVGFASLSVGTLLVNTSRTNSRAWVDSLAASPTSSPWNVSQPFNPITLPVSQTFAPTERNNWANGDTVQIYTPITVYVGKYTPHSENAGGSSGTVPNATNYITRLFNGGTAEFNNRSYPAHLGGDLNAIEYASSKFTAWDGDNYGQISSVVNCMFDNFYGGKLGQAGLSVPNPWNDFQIIGGLFGPLGLHSGSQSFLDGDVMLHTGSLEGGPWVMGAVWMPATSNLNIETEVQVSSLNYSAGIYGSGSLDMIGTGRLYYTATASAAIGALSTFQLNGSGVACNGGPTLLPTGCNITLTTANLAAAMTPTTFGGNAWIPGGASITNVGL